MTYGPKAALNVATLRSQLIGMDFTITDATIGFAAGGFAEYRLSPKFAVEAAVMYSLQGAKYKGIPQRLTFQYINLPVLLKIYIDEHFNLFFGPQGGILLNARDTDRAENTKKNITSDMRRLDTGMQLGMGYNFPMGLNIFVNYTIGLPYVVNTYGQTPSRGKNYVMQFGTAWRF